MWEKYQLSHRLASDGQSMARKAKSMVADICLKTTFVHCKLSLEVKNIHAIR